MTQQLKTVRLHGIIGSKFGRVHRIAVSSAGEAVKALGSQIRGFDAFFINAKDNGLVFAVFYGKKNLTKDELLYPCGDDDIRIAPIVIGSKNGGWLNVIIGAILIIVAVWVPGAQALLAPGIAMVAGGVVQLLAPIPKGRSSQDAANNQASYTFNGPINTQAQGAPVQLVYGLNIVGSAVLSAGIDAIDHSYIPSGLPGKGSGGGGGGGAPAWNDTWSNV